MNTQIKISHNTNRAGLGGYSVELYDTDGAPYALRQVGAVDNGLVSYRGVFATDDEALRAAPMKMGFGFRARPRRSSGNFCASKKNGRLGSLRRARQRSRKNCNS